MPAPPGPASIAIVLLPRKDGWGSRPYRFILRPLPGNEASYPKGERSETMGFAGGLTSSPAAIPRRKEPTARPNLSPMNVPALLLILTLALCCAATVAGGAPPADLDLRQAVVVAPEGLSGPENKAVTMLV